MHSTLILAATEATGGSSGPVIGALPFILGMLMVALAILRGANIIAARITPGIVQPPAPAPAAAPPAARPAADPVAAPAAPVAAGTPPEIVAVIAATVATLTGRSSRVVSIRRIDTAWEKAGRQSVLSSHRIR